MSTVDLANLFASTKGKASIDNDVALFKDADPGKPRVVADAHLYIIYSLKNRSVLRLLARATNHQNTIKLHQTDVSAVKFVNYKSNVVASCGEDDEFFVWFISKGEGDKPDATVYFRLRGDSEAKLKVRAFSWFVDNATNVPNIVMTYNDTCGVLNCGRTISSYTNTAAEITVKEFAKPFDRKVATTGPAFACNGADGLFAFNLDSTTVVTCTAKNTNTPSWKPTSGEAIIAMEVLQGRPPVLVAASASAVWIWDVAAEPNLIRKLSCSQSGVCTLVAAGLTFGIFTPNKVAYVVEMTPEGGFVGEKFELTKQVNALCLSPSVGVSAFVVTGDFGDRLSIIVLKKESPTDLLGTSASSAPAALLASPAQPSTAAPPVSPSSPFLPPPTRRDTQPLLNSGQQPPPYPGAISTPMQSPLIAGSPLVGRPLLNPSLPQLSQDGAIALTLEETGREVQLAKDRVDSALQNTAQILGLTATNVKKDHAALTSLSLEAQMTELQRSGVGAAGPAQSSANSGIFEQKFVNTLLEQVASTIIEGLVPGVRAAILEDLEPGIRNVVAKQWKKSNRDVFKQRVDALIKDSAQAFIAELETKQKAYEKNLEFYAKEVKRAAEGGLQKLSSQIIVLEDQLNAVTQSRLLDEVKELRRTVRELREAAASGAPTTSDLPPTTLVANAKQMIVAGDVSRGFEYIVRVHQPELTLSLLAELDSDELHNSVCENGGVTDKIWIDVLTHCALATKVQRLGLALGWIRDVLADRSTLLQSGALKSALQTFTTSWKPQVSQDRDLTRELKQIERVVS